MTFTPQQRAKGVPGTGAPVGRPAGVASSPLEITTSARDVDDYRPPHGVGPRRTVKVSAVRLRPGDVRRQHTLNRRVRRLR